MTSVQEALARLRADQASGALEELCAFITRYGDRVDLMPLDRAGAVAKFGALNYGEPLVERVPEMLARLRIAAFGQYRDEEPFRRAALERLAHGS